MMRVLCWKGAVTLCLLLHSAHTFPWCHQLQFSCFNIPISFSTAGPTASRRYISEPIHEGYSSCSTSRPNSGLKEEPYEKPPQHVTKEDSKMPFSRDDPKDSLDVAERVNPCAMFSGAAMLAKASCEQARPLHHALGQHLPMQVMLEQRRRLCMRESSYAQRSDHPGLLEHVADGGGGGGDRETPKLVEQCGAEEKRMLMGMGMGLGGHQTPYVSLNLHHVLAKHSSSFQGPAAYTLGHLTDNYNYRGEEINPYLYRGQSPASSSSPESHREILPHYIGTSVIITNER